MSSKAAASAQRRSTGLSFVKDPLWKTPRAGSATPAMWRIACFEASARESVAQPKLRSGDVAVVAAGCSDQSSQSGANMSAFQDSCVSKNGMPAAWGLSASKARSRAKRSAVRSSASAKKAASTPSSRPWLKMPVPVLSLSSTSARQVSTFSHPGKAPHMAAQQAS